MGGEGLLQWTRGYSFDVGLFGVALGVEGVLPRQHLEHDDAEGPHVNALSVSLADGLLRRHEEYRAHDLVDVALTVEHVRVHFCGETEVGDFCDIPFEWILRGATIRQEVLVDQNVFRFEIPVNKVLFMELVHALTNVPAN